MKILVTGSSGFIGREVVKALAAHGAEPVAFDPIPPRPGDLPDGVPYVRGLSGDLQQLMAAIVEHKVQRIVAQGYIMAALDRPDYQDFVGAVETNVLGITYILEAARLLGLDRVVLASSIGVYGPQSAYGEKAITEDVVPTVSGSTYSLMKLLDENLAERYRQRYGMKIVVVRPSATLGAGNTMRYPLLLNPIAVGKPGYANFPADSRHCLVHVQDLADLYARIATAASVAHDLYLGTGHTFYARELADIVHKYLPDAEVHFSDERPYTLVSLFDNSQAKQDLGWTLHSLEESVLMHLNEARADAGLAPLPAR